MPVHWDAARWDEAARMARRVLDQVAQAVLQLPERELQALIALAEGRTEDFMSIMESHSGHVESREP